MKNEFLLATARGPIHLSAIADYFERNPSLTPESIALELEHVRDCMVHAVPETCAIKDVQATHKLIGELIIMFREM